MAIKVKATQVGFYGDLRRKEGSVFFIDEEKQFSSRWMEKLDGKNDESSGDEHEHKSQRARGKHKKAEAQSHDEDSVI
jgi:hypothetical protein